ncbi:hypothetical protein [Roseovarius spongiae]|nr:hypothetical protein [Roseovarius spongiae]
MRAVLIVVQAGILIILAVIGAGESGERSAHSPINAPAMENHVNL